MSRDRIKTTHVGSLPRTTLVSEVVGVADVAPELADAVLSEAIDVVVQHQVRLGLDIISDGEFSKVTYVSYITERLDGFAGDNPLITPADFDDFPGAATLSNRRRSTNFARPACVGEVTLRSTLPVQQDIRRLRQSATRHQAADAFLTAPSPGLIAIFLPNRHYPTHQAYLEALSRALREEYKAVTDAGLMLQIDCPDLAMGRHTIFKNSSEAAFLRHARDQVEALNNAVAGLPLDRIRIYVSWGNYEGPHTHDIPLERILPTIHKAHPRQLMIEAATPTHQHEWSVFERLPLPDDKILVPGVIDVTNNYVEHPEVVAERLSRYISLLGRDRVIASTDSGFAAYAGDQMVDPAVAYRKLESLVRGAELATERQ